MLDVTNKKQGFYLRNLVQVADHLRAIPESIEDDGSITHYPTPTEGNLMKSHSYGVVFEYLLAFRANTDKPTEDTQKITEENKRLTSKIEELEKRLENLPTLSNAHETLHFQQKIDSLTLSNTGLTKDLEDGRNQYQQVLDEVRQRDETIQSLETQVRQLTADVSQMRLPELDKVTGIFETWTANTGKPKKFTPEETLQGLIKLWKSGRPYPG